MSSNYHSISAKTNRRSVLLLTILGLTALVIGQTADSNPVQQKLDSLKMVALQVDGDHKIGILKDVTQLYFTGFYQLDSAKKYATQLRETSQLLNHQKGLALSDYYLGRVADGKGDYASAIRYSMAFLNSEEVRQDTNLLANGLYSMANIYIHQGNLEEAMNYQLQVLRLDEASGNQNNIGLSLNNLGIIMKELNRDAEAIQYLERTYSIFENSDNRANMAMALSNLGGLYSRQGNQVKALETFKRSLSLYQEVQNQRGIALAYQHLGAVEREMGEYREALNHIKKSVVLLQEISLKKEIAESLHQMALTFYGLQQNDSVQFYLLESLELAKQVGDKKLIRSCYKELSDLEAKEENFRQAFQYFQLFHAMNDSIFNESTADRISQLETQYAVEKQEAEILNLRTKQQLNDRNNRTLRWALIATTFLTLLIITFLIYRVRTNRKLLKLEQTQNREIERAYEELKSTQAQLIQSEKMASLGELTAGIAHEIQNPLNFVNNFSEVSNELLDELNEELIHSNKEEIKQITEDLKNNLAKISQHGERASSIVKNMLLHSRNGAGEKEPTNINALCDEYLRIAFHGMRARDKTFQSKFQLDLDENLPKINIVTQDLGRVLLNIINNAFHAVAQKSKQNLTNYEPLVKVSTRKKTDQIEIRISDNGSGIPEELRNKIFQPFFTTKPAGQGTGLGLSLSFDIIKRYNGTLEFESGEEKGSEFLIKIPFPQIANA